MVRNRARESGENTNCPVRLKTRRQKYAEVGEVEESSKRQALHSRFCEADDRRRCPAASLDVLGGCSKSLCIERLFGFLVIYSGAGDATHE